MSGDGEATVDVEGHSVRSGLGAAEWGGALVAAGMKEGGDARGGAPCVDGVGGDVGEVEAVFGPYGAFEPGEAGGEALELCVGWNDLIDGGIEPVCFKRH